MQHIRNQEMLSDTNINQVLTPTPALVPLSTKYMLFLNSKCYVNILLYFFFSPTFNLIINIK